MFSPLSQLFTGFGSIGKLREETRGVTVWAEPSFLFLYRSLLAINPSQECSSHSLFYNPSTSNLVPPSNPNYVASRLQRVQLNCRPLPSQSDTYLSFIRYSKRYR
jgi:hypothetical protein